MKPFMSAPALDRSPVSYFEPCRRSFSPVMWGSSQKIRGDDMLVADPKFSFTQPLGMLLFHNILSNLPSQRILQFHDVELIRRHNSDPCSPMGVYLACNVPHGFSSYYEKGTGTRSGDE